MTSNDEKGNQATSETRTQSDILETLAHGRIDLSGQFVWGSNYTFLVKVGDPKHQVDAVYKPAQGERPLWDFPRYSLAKREVAAYLTSAALGWNLVPPTVLRKDGPAGTGSLQLFIHSNPNHHYFNFSEQEIQLLRPTVVFDLLINNADRKGGHVFIAQDDQVWLIDHGLSFHVSYKLRTVIWDFIGEPIPETLLKDLERFCQKLQKGDNLHRQLNQMLSQAEIEALGERSTELLREGVFPEPGPGRPVPWPQI